MGSVARAMYGHITKYNSNHADPVSNTISLQFIPTFPIAQGEVYEAEKIGTDGIESTDYDASGDTCVQLSAADEYVSITLTQSAYRLPEGDYKIFVRAKDSNHIVDDLRLGIHNLTDSASMGTSVATLTGSYALYESDTITITSDQIDDNLMMYASKRSANANIISIDFIGFVRV
jgi:hypothetical protein